jgi:hypothetical protein
MLVFLHPAPQGFNHGVRLIGYRDRDRHRRIARLKTQFHIARNFVSRQQDEPDV